MCFEGLKRTFRNFECPRNRAVIRKSGIFEDFEGL